jgi:type IV secretory pathway ATPase VirB11/archaellum biosynthesis ATPase
VFADQTTTGAETEPESCGCTRGAADEPFVLDGSDCPGGAALATAPACRATAARVLGKRDVDRVVTRTGGLRRRYGADGAALLAAAGRFAARVRGTDPALADRAEWDPLEAARRARGRGGRVERALGESGLALCAERHDGYGTALRALVGATVADAWVRPAPPDGGRFEQRREIGGDRVVRTYRYDEGMPCYHLEPPEAQLGPAALDALAAAHERLAAEGETGRTAVEAAVRAVVDDGPTGPLADTLEKHTRGLGVVEDCFSDPAVSDVFLTAPVEAGPLSVRVDGERMRTNLYPTATAVDALASRFRRRSGRAFSRANPTLDAADEVAGRTVRVAGVTDPVSDGTGFVLRAHDRTAWRLTDLVGNGTLTPWTAGLLSVAVGRGAAILVAGARGAGKTTLLSALLWELPRATRCLVVEDTPELPVGELREAGRDVQSLSVDPGDGPGLSPTEALRTALRLGEGALVVGEVRGAEARVLYDAMRVGAGDGAVLGTVHGKGATAVRDRVVSELDVPPAAFGATDLVVTVEHDGNGRRVSRIEEVLEDEDGGTAFASLYEEGRTDRVDRGRSRLLGSLARPGGTYADVREAVNERAGTLERGS